MGKTPSNEPVSLTIQQVADELQVHPATVRRMISRGDLRAYRYGASQVIRIDRADLNKLRRPVTTLADYRDAKAQYGGGAAWSAPALQGRLNRASGRNTETASGELCAEQVAHVRHVFLEATGRRISARAVCAEWVKFLRRRAVVDTSPLTMVDGFAEQLVAELGEVS
jgi:excisionase family DNA binding protein